MKGDGRFVVRQNQGHGLEFDGDGRKAEKKIEKKYKMSILGVGAMI